MMPLGELSPVAKRQLAAWEEVARDWATFQVLDVDTGIWIERCSSCFTGIYRVTDEHGKPYQYTDEQKLAQVVAHLRQAHSRLDPDR